MAKGVSIQVEGLDRLIKKLGRIPDAVSAEIDAELSAVANEFMNRARGDAPVDQGLLINSITVNPLKVMDYEVVSGADYSAYVEFGTKSKVQIPADLAAYAAQFKGAKSTGDAKQMIYAWCKRVGIEEKYWFAVYVKIMRDGIRPHPFFFKQLPQAQADINKNLKEVVIRALQ
jgi:hypothetical protein